MVDERIDHSSTKKSKTISDIHGYQRRMEKKIPTAYCPVSTAQLESHRSLPSSSNSLFHRMSLPRSNYDPRRVCLNPFPEISLGKHRRAVGVYLAGALVCCRNLQRSQHAQPKPDICLFSYSLLSQIGRFWMLQFYQHTPSHHGDQLRTRKRLSMSPSSTGFRASVLCWDTWS